MTPTRNTERARKVATRTGAATAAVAGAASGAASGGASGAGDPARTVALLWRRSLPAPPRSRGPRQGLRVEAVVEAAVALADAEGLEAVTMRRVAQAVGTAPMTLYTYVPGRAELVDLMLDHAYERMRPPDAAPSRKGGWRARVGAVALANRALYERHPWMAFVDTSRPTLGPGAIGKYERELAALDALGLDDVTLDAALAWVLAFVREWARTTESARRLRRETGRDEQQWWAAAAPVLAEVLDARSYPLATRVGQAAGEAQGAAWHPARAFDFGLERVIDGLAALIGDGARPATSRRR